MIDKNSCYSKFEDGCFVAGLSTLTDEQQEEFMKALDAIKNDLDEVVFNTTQKVMGDYGEVIDLEYLMVLEGATNEGACGVRLEKHTTYNDPKNSENIEQILSVYGETPIEALAGLIDQIPRAIEKACMEMLPSHLTEDKLGKF